MPAMLDDPSAAAIHRTSGPLPFPNPHDLNPSLPTDILPRQVTLRDRVTIATVIPFASEHHVPPSLRTYLSDQLNMEISNGDTYPHMEPMSAEFFTHYWFQNFGAIMLLGSIASLSEIMEGKDWSKECLGSFYIKPNYPGRSSHICNAGFLVTSASRNRGVGRLMGESYLEWAPKLGYSYSVFNLVYETNVASCRIWDALGFKRIGRVKGAGNLKSYPGQLIDAIIFGRDLVSDGEDFMSEERFDKIKFYLKYGKYPAGADRHEKSRLRSAATHYKLKAETDQLMLKDKEVISDPQRQYEIAHHIHVQQHAGINKTTAMIAEKYHWVRIKETVSLVIRNCPQCKEVGKNPILRPDGVIQPVLRNTFIDLQVQGGVNATGRALTLVGQPEVQPQQRRRQQQQQQHQQHDHQRQHHIHEFQHLQHPHQHQHQHPHPHLHLHQHQQHPHQNQPPHQHRHQHQHQHGHPHQHQYQHQLSNQHTPGQGSVSPQMLNRSLPRSNLDVHNSGRLIGADRNGDADVDADADADADADTDAATYMPLDPQIMDFRPALDDETEHFHDSDSFQAMLGGGHGVGVGVGVGVGGRQLHEEGETGLDMLIDDEDADADADADADTDAVDVHHSTKNGVDIQLHAEAAARATDEALASVKREYAG